MLVPDSELFQANVCSTYNVIEAACKLGVKKIIIASSETTYGVCFAQGDADYHSFPLEEDYDVDPEDSCVQLPSFPSQSRPTQSILQPKLKWNKQLRPLQNLQRENRAYILPPLQRRHLRPTHRKRHRASRIRARFPLLPLRPSISKAQRMVLHRRARPRADLRFGDPEKRVGVPGV